MVRALGGLGADGAERQPRSYLAEQEFSRRFAKAQNLAALGHLQLNALQPVAAQAALQGAQLAIAIAAAGCATPAARSAPVSPAAAPSRASARPAARRPRTDPAMFAFRFGSSICGNAADWPATASADHPEKPPGNGSPACDPLRPLQAPGAAALVSRRPAPPAGPGSGGSSPEAPMDRGRAAAPAADPPALRSAACGQPSLQRRAGWVVLTLDPASCDVGRHQSPQLPSIRSPQWATGSSSNQPGSLWFLNPCRRQYAGGQMCAMHSPSRGAVGAGGRWQRQPMPTLRLRIGASNQSIVALFIFSSDSRTDGSRDKCPRSVSHKTPQPASPQTPSNLPRSQ